MGHPNLFAAPTHLKRLQLEVTTGCNLRCVGCPRTVAMLAGTWRNAHMKLKTFADIIRNAPPADMIVLQGIGEPTLHPKLPQMIGMARDAGKFGLISFNTNALARESGYYAELKALGLGHISISVDSLVPDTAEAARAGTDTAALRDAIPALMHIFPGRVTLSIVLSRLNLAGLPALLGELHALGGRFVEIQPMISYTDANDPLCLGADDLAQAQRIVAECAVALPGLGVALASAMTPNGGRCRRPFHAAYVTVDGFMTPCCTTNDVNLFGRTSLAVMPFAEAWLSPGVTEWLQRYFDTEPEICLSCAFNPSGSYAGMKSAPPRFANAQALLQAGKLDQAETVYNALLAGSDRAEALHGLGLVKVQRGDSASALPLLQAAHVLGPNARLTHNLASVLFLEGRTVDAIAYERQNLTDSPNYVGSYQALAEMLQRGGDGDGARAVLAALDDRSGGIFR
jgi:MoaA/NifB/PqqE/SkfB family radical SAM enzyme